MQVVGSLTDATVKDTNSAPWSKDLLITAEKRVNGEHLTESKLNFRPTDSRPVSGQGGVARDWVVCPVSGALSGQSAP